MNKKKDDEHDITTFIGKEEADDITTYVGKEDANDRTTYIGSDDSIVANEDNTTRLVELDVNIEETSLDFTFSGDEDDDESLTIQTVYIPPEETARKLKQKALENTGPEPPKEKLSLKSIKKKIKRIRLNRIDKISLFLLFCTIVILLMYDRFKEV